MIYESEMTVGHGEKSGFTFWKSEKAILFAEIENTLNPGNIRKIGI